MRALKILRVTNMILHIAAWTIACIEWHAHKPEYTEAAWWAFGAIILSFIVFMALHQLIKLIDKTHE